VKKITANENFGHFIVGELHNLKLNNMKMNGIKTIYDSYIVGYVIFTFCFKFLLYIHIHFSVVFLVAQYAGVKSLQWVLACVACYFIYVL